MQRIKVKFKIKKFKKSIKIELVLKFHKANYLRCNYKNNRRRDLINNIII